MPQLRNPEAPATKKQLFRLHELTGNDTRKWTLNMQQASSMIEGLELSQPIYDNKLEIPDDESPFQEPNITLIEGPQRSGKSTVAIAKMVDDYYNDGVRIYCKSMLGLDEVTVKAYDWQNRLAKIKQNGDVKVVKISDDYSLHTPMRIFSRMHIYGGRWQIKDAATSKYIYVTTKQFIKMFNRTPDVSKGDLLYDSIKYVFCPSYKHILHWLKTGLISRGWLLMDEAAAGISARASMTAIGREMSVQNFQFGKSMLKVIIISHVTKLVDWTARMIPTEWISCEFNKKTKYITYKKRVKGKPGEKEISFYAPVYYEFFWTNERVNG